MGRPDITDRDRFFWATVMRMLKGWREAFVIVQPATVAMWRRSGFRPAAGSAEEWVYPGRTTPPPPYPIAAIRRLRDRGYVVFSSDKDSDVGSNQQHSRAFRHDPFRVICMSRPADEPDGLQRPTVVRPTATLKHLAQQHRLHDRDLVPGESRSAVASFLRQILSTREGIAASSCPPGWLLALEERFVVVRSARAFPSPGLPFAFVEAVNFELTYGCNLACKHCLQDGLRPSGRIPWIDLGVVAQALEDASWLGLARTGVNFTGGEVYLPSSPILELIQLASDFGINVRSNTNAWWGGRTGFTVGTTRFGTDAELVSRLHTSGLSILAMSLDDRYEQYPELLDRVVSVAASCEEIGQAWEVVATDPSPGLAERALSKVVSRIGGQPKHLSLTPMDTVDIGAAAESQDSALQAERLAELTTMSPCRGKGFHRPEFLHVNPTGGIRSCLYAPGADVLGNLSAERFPEILNRADQNPVVRLFSQGTAGEFVRSYISPWKHLYRDLQHPCAASALIARVAGALPTERQRVGRDLSESEMERLHRGIAASWSVQR